MKTINLRIRCLLALTVICLLLAGCGTSTDTSASDVSFNDLTKTGSMELSYAEGYTVDYYGDDYSLVTAGDDSYMICEEGCSIPSDLPDGCTAICKPLNGIYNSAPSTMDFFLVLDAMDQVTMTGTKEADWSIPEIGKMVADGSLTYVGKYSAPDYEYILSEEPGLAIESTMIYHCPEVKENLESLDIPVLVDKSSLEADPLGRLEWIKLYGLLAGRLDEANDYFDSQVEVMSKELADSTKASGDKTVAFFYVNTQGAVNVRRPGDYITRMIELAGGRYAFDESIIEAGGSQAAITIQMEAFYDAAKDADILVYNSVIDDNLDSLDELYAKSELFKDFKAVREGNVYCADSRMYQEISGTCEMVLDYNKIVTDEDVNESELKFLHKVK